MTFEDLHKRFAAEETALKAALQLLAIDLPQTLLRSNAPNLPGHRRRPEKPPRG